MVNAESIFQVPTITAVANEDSAATDSTKVNGAQKKSDLSPLDLSCSNNGERLVTQSFKCQMLLLLVFVFSTF